MPSSPTRTRLVLLAVVATVVATSIVLSRTTTHSMFGSPFDAGPAVVSHSSGIVVGPIEEPTLIPNPPTVVAQMSGGQGRLVVREDSGYTLRPLDPAGQQEPFSMPANGLVRSWSPDGSAVLLTREVSETMEIILADSQGANPRVAGTLPFIANQISIAWSPDGTKVALAAGIRPNDPDRFSTIYLLERDGALMIDIGSIGWMGNTLVWSPDSRGLAYYTKGEIEVLPLDGGPPLRFGKSFHQERLTWGADGKLYMFGCDIDSFAMCSLDPFAEDTPQPIPGMIYGKVIISKTEDSEEAEVEVVAVAGESPDKQWLMLKSWMTGALILYNTATNTAATVYLPAAGDSDSYEWSAWSPDSRYVTFQRYHNALTYVYQPGSHEAPAPLISEPVEAWVR